jgi:16S rRNA (adenine1518-N6/adenine1519-N6)-dimethyltransferase
MYPTADLKDLSNIQTLKDKLKQFGVHANKRFGQNFLVDSFVLDRIVEAADLLPSDTIVEVGSGPGGLTQRLGAAGASVISLEIDDRMIPLLRNTVQVFKNVEVLHTDVLQWNPPFVVYKVIANIPYYITSPILKHFLRRSLFRPSRIVLMIQREVAERICSRKKPTLLSWEIMVFGTARIVCPVPSSSFYPSPKVDSAVVCIDLFDEPLVAEDMLGSFFSVLEKGYRQPRKTLANNFKGTAVVLPHELKTLRPHQLSLDEWIRLIT